MDIKQYLEDAAIEYSHIVTSKLAKGSIVSKGSGHAYEIDNPEIFKRLEYKVNEFPEGAVPYGYINKYLRQSMGIRGLFEREGSKCGSKLVLPFSRIFEARIGECLEKAILVQLAAQLGRNSFLIKGVLEQDSEVGVDNHAYNIVFNNEKPYLVDAHNPFYQKNIPYIVPILNIEGKTGNIVVPDEDRAGRSYYLA